MVGGTAAVAVAGCGTSATREDDAASILRQVKRVWPTSLSLLVL